MNRLYPVLFLLLTALMLTGCSSSYANASATPPNTWASYTCHDLTFRFEAGWQTCSSENLQTEMANALNLLGDDTRLTLLDQLASPRTDQGTYNYLTLAYYTMSSAVTGEELESIMKELNEMDMVLETAERQANIIQKSRIRIYGEELTALTFCVEMTEGKVSCLSQIALIPHGNLLYQVVYSDFSTGEDNSVLEQFLTGLVLP